tara:strand:- start:1537 stop:2121 length:585 start_codon:yes stop_codon:yes gene_type:complete
MSNEVKEYFLNIGELSNDDIIDQVDQNKENLTFSHKINGRWENQYLSIDHVPQLKKIFHFACKVGKKIIGKPLVVPYKEMGLPMDEFWFNIARPGESTGWHDHKDRSVLSGVYYLKVPDNAGDILFRKRDKDKIVEWNIRSETGKLILFHSNIEHSVKINKSNHDRISIAFNLFSLPLQIDSDSDGYSSNNFYF